MSRVRGISEEKLSSLNEFEASPLFSDQERDCLRYAQAMTELPLNVSDDLFGRLRKRFSEAQLVELTATIAWENFRARFDHALDMKSQELTPEDVTKLAAT